MEGYGGHQSNFVRHKDKQEQGDDKGSRHPASFNAKVSVHEFIKPLNEHFNEVLDPVGNPLHVAGSRKDNRCHNQHGKP